MLGKFGILIVVAAVLVPALAVVPSNKRSIIIGTDFIFADTTALRNRAQALAFCASQDGELAKVTGANYNLLRVSIPTVGSYWIDGIDKADGDRFNVNTTCTAGAGKVDLTGIPPANLDIPASSCLSLVKGSTRDNSKIQAVSCASALRGVLCSYPLAGCVTTTTTVTPGP